MADSPSTAKRWILLSYRVPREPSTPRVALWRKLRELGALYLQPSVCVVPDCGPMRSGVEAARALVRDGAGEDLCVPFEATDEAAALALSGQYNALRAAEYAELSEQAEGMLRELERESDADKFSFAELEENEHTLARLHLWSERIASRDVLACPDRATASALLERCAQALQQFRAATLAREMGSDS